MTSLELTIRVLIAANSAIARAGLEAILTTSSTLTVVASVSNQDNLLEHIEVTQPDVVLMELELQEEDPIAALPMLNDGLTAPALVVLVDNVQSAWAGEVLQAGVRGILPAEAIATEMIATVEAVAAGLVVLHPDFLDALPSAPVPTRTLPSSSSQTLTPREVEVLGMLAEGLGNKAIARRLQISEHTVKFHISSIFSKLNASSRTEAVMLGARQGLILL
ncbi:MAG TPA: response regulator transcription factor [Crinalium sp.]